MGTLRATEAQNTLSLTAMKCDNATWIAIVIYLAMLVLVLILLWI